MKRTYMIVEHFRGGDARPVYERFRARGRLAPEGLTYVTSWVDRDLSRCFQVMETQDPALLERWMDQWRDLVDFEVHEVIDSATASERVFSTVIREARPSDADAIRSLLRDCRLPTDGVPDELTALYVAQTRERVVGVAGLEIHGSDGLVRSVAVAPEARGQRVASRLCAEVEARAQAFGVRRLFLLTETAERFFRRRGYALLDRTLAPEPIRASREFSSICPASAVSMMREARPDGTPRV